jgi:hypothetical protein
MCWVRRCIGRGEQITHYRYLKPATDVFSVAAVFYELLTGKWVRGGLRPYLNAAGRINASLQFPII